MCGVARLRPSRGASEHGRTHVCGATISDFQLQTVRRLPLVAVTRATFTAPAGPSNATTLHELSCSTTRTVTSGRDGSQAASAGSSGGVVQHRSVGRGEGGHVRAGREGRASRARRATERGTEATSRCRPRVRPRVPSEGARVDVTSDPTPAHDHCRITSTVGRSIMSVVQVRMMLVYPSTVEVTRCTQPPSKSRRGTFPSCSG